MAMREWGWTNPVLVDEHDPIIEGARRRRDGTTREALWYVLDNVDGPIDVQSNRGEVFVRVPVGTTVDADLRSERGDLFNSCPRGTDVKVKVRLKRGDISVVEATSD